MAYVTAKMTKMALRILFDSCAVKIYLYKTGDEYPYLMYEYADMNGAIFAKIGDDIRLVEII